MKVKLRRTWIAPNLQRFREGIQEVPSEYRGALPSDAKVLENPVPQQPEPKPDPKSDLKARIERMKGAT